MPPRRSPAPIRGLEPGPRAPPRVVLAAAAALWLGAAGPLLVWRFGSAAAMPVLVLVAAAAGALAAVAAIAGLLLAQGQNGLGWVALMVGAVTVAVAVQLWAGLVAAGLAADRAAVVVALALVTVQSSLPRVATELAGLGRLADAVADGDAVRGHRVRLAADQARELLAALLAGTGVAVALAVARLAGAGGVAAAALAGLLAAVLLLQARRYSSTAHVLHLVLAALAGQGRSGRAGPRHRRGRLHDPAGPAGLPGAP